MIDTETLLVGMAVHGITPMVGNQAKRGRVVMHAGSVREACEELLKQAAGPAECALKGHVVPFCGGGIDRVAAYICGRCGRSVKSEEEH